MKLSFVLSLLTIVSTVFAGGIRGAYERMFIWYAYQAQIDGLMKTYGNLDALTICPYDYGSGREKTLLFNEFIEVTNREVDADRGAIPSITDSLTPDVDKMANTLLRGKNGESLMKPRWPWAGRIMVGASYTTLLQKAAAVVWDMKQESMLGPSNAHILKATRAIQMVVLSRKIDYEKYRMPAMESQFKDVKFVTWDLILQSEPKAREFDLEETVKQNPNVEDLAKKIDLWVKAYHTQPVEGEKRASHWNALKEAKVAESRATYGGC